MFKILYFLNIRYLPPLVLGLPIDFQGFLSPAFINAQEAVGLRINLIKIIIQEMRKVDKRRLSKKQMPIFNDVTKAHLKQWIEIDQRFMAQFVSGGEVEYEG